MSKDTATKKEEENFTEHPCEFKRRGEKTENFTEHPCEFKRRDKRTKNFTEHPCEFKRREEKTKNFTEHPCEFGKVKTQKGTSQGTPVSSKNKTGVKRGRRRRKQPAKLKIRKKNPPFPYLI